MGRKKQQSFGVCKLTRTKGAFVDSHLIPKALTKPAQQGMPLFQFYSGKTPVKRWSSWYDPKLVTRAGENILAGYDTWAVSELRRHKFVWSGWDQNRTLGSLHQLIEGTPWGIRTLEGINQKRLRLFFLTLLWRAAATDLPEFSEVELPNTDLERLREMICFGNVEPRSFYPATLTQLSTIGPIHNHTPIAEVKTVPALESEPLREIPILRFYFDGLIVHMHRQSSDDGYTASLGNLVVGAEEKLLISTQTYEKSYQKANMETVLGESK